MMALPPMAIGTDHGNTQATVRELRPRQVMMFYYPGGVDSRDMGPTSYLDVKVILTPPCVFH